MSTTYPYANNCQAPALARQSNIENFIEIIYHKKRINSSLGYLSPEEFEVQTIEKQSQKVE